MESSNAAVSVSLLTSSDGCDVYRFVDGGSINYFVRCTSGDASTAWSKSCGKNCVKSESIQTIKEIRK